MMAVVEVNEYWPVAIQSVSLGGNKERDIFMDGGSLLSSLSLLYIRLKTNPKALLICIAFRVLSEYIGWSWRVGWGQGMTLERI